MTRREHREMQPSALKLQNQLGRMGQVMEPGDAEEPILEAGVRAAVFGWLAELNARDELASVGLKPRSSALLQGPPGCGKTTLAHHLAARLGIPMLLVGAENIVSSGHGDSEKNVARLFDGLQEFGKPCLLFLDEIDAIGMKRRDTSGDKGGAVGASNSTLTVLLRKIESFDGLMVAATNRGETLDSALWRRFGMQITVALPDEDARWAIIKRYGQPFQFDDGLIDLLTAHTAGASPSVLRQVMEGVKRLLVLGPRLRLPLATAESTFAMVLAQVKPPPEYELPILWSHPQAFLAQLADAGAWPPERHPEKGGTS